MPLLKEISSLKNLCLSNIADHVERHTICYLQQRNQVSFYLPFQRNFSDKLLELLLHMYSKVYCKGISYTRLQLLCLGVQMRNNLATHCMEFIFNPHLKTVFASFERGTFGYDLPVPIILGVIYYNCHNITMLDLRYLPDITDQLFVPVVVYSLRNVVHLDMSYTGVGDATLWAVTDNCHLLTHLDLSGTCITDEGIKMLCRNYLYPKENGRNLFGYCRNPTYCSFMPKLKYFNIDNNFVSNISVIWILQHFPSLEMIKCDDQESFRHRYPNSIATSIPKALLFLKKKVGTSSCCKMNLEELNFSDVEEVKNCLENALFLCPRLKIFKAVVPLENRQFLLVSMCEYLTNVTFRIEDFSTIASREFQSFLTVRGCHLTSFTLRGNLSVKTFTIFNILRHCQNLNQLHLIDLQMLPPTDDEMPHTACGEELFKNNVSLNELETFTASNVNGDKSAVSELISSIVSISKNIKKLRVSDSKVDDEAFSPVETCNALYNLEVLIFCHCEITQGLLWRFIKSENKLTMLQILDFEISSMVEDSEISKIFKEIKNYVRGKNLSLDINAEFMLPF